MKLDLRWKLNQINYFCSKKEKPWTSQKNASNAFDNFCLDLVFSKALKEQKAPEHFDIMPRSASIFWKNISNILYAFISTKNIQYKHTLDSTTEITKTHISIKQMT